MKKYRFEMILHDIDREAMRNAGFEPGQQIDKKALHSMMEEAIYDGAIEFNKRKNITITKEKERNGYGTKYNYVLHIEE